MRNDGFANLHHWRRLYFKIDPDLENLDDRQVQDLFHPGSFSDFVQCIRNGVHVFRNKSKPDILNMVPEIVVRNARVTVHNGDK